jgi:hypothetical protein
MQRWEYTTLIFGYMVGEYGTDRPAYEFEMPGYVPPGAIAAMMAPLNYAVRQQNTNAEFMAALLLMMF